MADYYEIKEELTIADSCLCFLTKDADVLEFGSATGYATRYMKEVLNCRVSCIEKSAEMAETGKSVAEKMIIADVENDIWESELEQKFDFIMFADILEHLKHPEDVIRRAIPFLKDNGFIISSIPNISHNAVIMGLKNNLFEYRETGLLDNTHIHFLTRKSINEIFNRNNLICVEEESKLIRPCDTEFGYYYIKNPFLALSIIHKNDAHVYRFVQKWSLKNNHNSPCVKPLRLSLFNQLYELVYDFMCYFKRKMKLKTPNLINFIMQKPAEIKASKKYDKYKS
jgi:2-polyprenyl-3-methyl-5-hydroxy-6-metoxy-1,4-benzoquinol methylase